LRGFGSQLQAMAGQAAIQKPIVLLPKHRRPNSHKTPIFVPMKHLLKNCIGVFFMLVFVFPLVTKSIHDFALKRTINIFMNWNMIALFAIIS
jgi:hypothetical protein